MKRKKTYRSVNILAALALLCVVIAVVLLLCACGAGEKPQTAPENELSQAVPEDEMSQAAPERLAGPLLTIHCADRDFDAYESFLWSTQWQDDGSGISADGLDPESVIREDAQKIPVVRYDEHLFFTCREDAEVLEKGLQIYADPSMQMISQFADLSGDWLSELKRLGPGKYWCCQKMRLQGKYVPAAEEYDSSCYACLFCLEIPAEEGEDVPEEFQELFGDFPSVPADVLCAEPIVVTDQEMRLYNKRLWDDFYARAQAGQPADVVLAYYLAGEEYADKPGFVSLQYDGSKFRTIQDFSRTGFGDLSYYSDVFSYMLEFDTGKEKILMLSDDPNFDYDAYRAEINAVPEDPDALTELPEYHGAIILLWEEVMSE